MFIIHFPLNVGERHTCAPFVGPFGSEIAAEVWLRENDRFEETWLIEPLTDPASEMFRSLLTS